MTTVSVFGGTGFLGQRLVRRLAAEGNDCARHPRPEEAPSALRAVGMERVTFFCVDVRDRGAVAGAVRGRRCRQHGVGLCGEGRRDFSRPCTSKARRRLCGRRLLPVSLASCSSPGSAPIPSPARRTSARAGAANGWSKKRFPGATIVRPSAMFGPGDALFGTLAHLPGCFLCCR